MQLISDMMKSTFYIYRILNNPFISPVQKMLENTLIFPVYDAETFKSTHLTTQQLLRPKIQVRNSPFCSYSTHSNCADNLTSLNIYKSSKFQKLKIEFSSVCVSHTINKKTAIVRLSLIANYIRTFQICSLYAYTIFQTQHSSTHICLFKSIPV